MVQAVWNGVVIADSDDTIVVEGNHYFPPASVKSEHFTASDKTTTCSWKGLANYYTVVVDGQENPDAAWYYAEPLPAASEIAGYVAFWRGVNVS